MHGQCSANVSGPVSIRADDDVSKTLANVETLLTARTNRHAHTFQTGCVPPRPQCKKRAPNRAQVKTLPAGTLNFACTNANASGHAQGAL
jgi:hypothetical protein